MTSALAAGEWSASQPGHFTPGERALGTHWIGGWMHPRTVLDDVEKILDLGASRQNARLHRAFSMFFFICTVGLWVLRPLTGLLYQPRMIGYGDCGGIGGRKIGRGNRSTRRKPGPA
jgi:hypothetical protein